MARCRLVGDLCGRDLGGHGRENEPSHCLLNGTIISNDQIIERFEQGQTPGGSFHHADHIRVAFAYLSQYSVLEAVEKFSAALQRFAAARGKPGLYHETITWAYLFLIRERKLRRAQPQTWEEFAANNPDLLTWESGKGGVLARYYQPETLASDAARSAFVLPDRSATSV